MSPRRFDFMFWSSLHVIAISRISLIHQYVKIDVFIKSRYVNGLGLSIRIPKYATCDAICPEDDVAYTDSFAIFIFTALRILVV